MFAFGAPNERDIYASLGPDPLWTIDFNLQKNLQVLDYRYFWIGGPILLSRDTPVPLVLRKAIGADRGSSVSLNNKLPSKPFYVEWINSAGTKYIYLIPVKELIEKNDLDSKRLLTIKFSLEMDDSFIVTAKDLKHKEPITLFNNKSINKNIFDLTDGKWNPFPLITFNYEVPSGFDASSSYIEGIPEINQLPHNNGYMPERGINPLSTSIRSGTFTMYHVNDIKDLVLIEWKDSQSNELISYRFNLKDKLKKLELIDKNKENSIYSFKKEILFRINKDNSLDVLFVTKELYANIKNKENQILIMRCEADNKCE